MSDLSPAGPPALVGHDPQWAVQAADMLAQLRAALAEVVDVGECGFDHIGSTAVPGLDAKAYVDLQVRMPMIPQPDVLDPVVTAVGWAAEYGSRVDSPGVTHDIPNPGDTQPDWVWAKRLFVSDNPQRPAILHVRSMASPLVVAPLRFAIGCAQNPNSPPPTSGSNTSSPSNTPATPITTTTPAAKPRSFAPHPIDLATRGQRQIRAARTARQATAF